jgi:GT2 family glycosyltransferase
MLPIMKSPEIPLQPKPLLEDISVVIPTLGRPILEHCLSWLAAGTDWPGALIVVDQGRNADVADSLGRFQAAGMNVIYVPSQQRGRSAGINRGLERVTTDYVAITDDDCFVTPNWLWAMTSRLRREPNVIFTGRVDQAGDDEVAFSVVTSRMPKRYDRPQLRAHPFIGGNVGLSMTLVQRIGLFNEHPCLQSAEDSDYGYRALRLGIPIAYDPEIVLLHYHWRDAGQRRMRYAEYSRSQGGFYGTHLRHGDPFILVQATRDLLRGPIRWLRGMIKQDQDMTDRGRADTLYLLPGILTGLRST